MKQIITKTEKQTFNLGKKMAKKLKGGEIVALVGELGTGKTVFIKGLAAELGIKKHITSPTFVLLKNYRIKNQKSKIKNLCHIDAYRLTDGQQLVDIGVLDYFNQPNTVCVIEWADRVKSILPKKRIDISFKHGKRENERILKISNSPF